MPVFAAMQLKLRVCNSGYRGAGFLRARLPAEGSDAGDRPLDGRKEDEFLAVSKNLAAMSARDLLYNK
jgi:hypothetical protein